MWTQKMVSVSVVKTVAWKQAATVENFGDAALNKRISKISPASNDGSLDLYRLRMCVWVHMWVLVYMY